MGGSCNKERETRHTIHEIKEINGVEMTQWSYPTWPYEMWRKIDGSNNRLITITNHLALRHFRNDYLEPNEESQLSKLIERLEPITNIFACSINNDIMKDVKTIMDKLVFYLQKQGEVFTDCRLIETGSISERTKVITPDEFDFIIVLDALANEDLFNYNWTIDSNLQVEIQDCNLYKHTFSKQEFLCTARNSSSKTYITGEIQRICARYMCTFMNEQLPDNWTSSYRLDNVKSIDNPCLSSRSVTFHLTSLRYNLNLSIEICIGVPININNVKHMTNKRKHKYYAKPKMSDIIMSLMLVKDVDYIALLSAECFSEHKLDVSVSVSMLELSQMRCFDTIDGRLQTYRLAKIIVKMFLPYYVHPFKCQFCGEGLVKSYHLKNLILYMINYYGDDDHWKTENLSKRVHEVFSILRYCIDNTNGVLCRYTLAMLPIKGSFYCKLPDYNEQFLQTDHPEANRIIRKWFDDIKANTGDKSAMLTNLESFLYRLSHLE